MLSPFEQPDATRWRCHAPTSDRGGRCWRPARWKGTDPSLGDARAFYCDDHKPAGAEPLQDQDAWQELELAAIILLPASTLHRRGGAIAGEAIVKAALAAAGARLVLVRRTGVVGGRQPTPPLQT